MGHVAAGDIVSTSHGVIDVIQQRVELVEFGLLHAGTPTIGDVAVMDIGEGFEGSETAKVITDDLSSWRNDLLGIVAYLVAGKFFHTAKLNTLREALLIGLHGRHRRELVLSECGLLQAR